MIDTTLITTKTLQSHQLPPKRPGAMNVYGSHQAYIHPTLAEQEVRACKFKNTINRYVSW